VFVVGEQAEEILRFGWAIAQDAFGCFLFLFFSNSLLCNSQDQLSVEQELAEYFSLDHQTCVGDLQ
jgi:hypothetical protein